MKVKVIGYLLGVIVIVLVIPLALTSSIGAINQQNIIIASSDNEKLDGIRPEGIKANDIYIVVGQEIDTYKNVPVYYNGTDFAKSFGESYAADGYYFGLKWQCVEFVKRFYYTAKNHTMPDGFGNAKDFYDSKTTQGALNLRRGLLQYRNGGNVKPQPDDILVFTDTKYGHVGIITKVTSTSVEIIQQNEAKSRETYPLQLSNGRYIVGSSRKPACWLRIP
ncbi:MAG TPA: CHAP domain-containing protein [Candidatus Deferrimicrobium sp.]|nr:CHAP domain-containing protein [Candidatus Deferrimicrobium sp.]